MENFTNNSIFWIELNKIVPNPYQPRIEFDETKLKDLSVSIKQYGVLQPIVVSRIEKETPDGGLASFYEIIAGERRFRASKMAGLEKIPAIIREGEQTDREKLELAIIENLQREDLNPIDKARSFEKLVNEFGLKHSEVAEKMGKSREYVSNSLRLLLLPEQILSAVNSGRITEGHTRPLLMLKDRPEDQMSLFKEITSRRLTVREAEKIARSVAVDKIRKKKSDFDPEIKDIENKLSDTLGTKVSIEKKQVGGKVTIEYFSQDDLQKILEAVKSGGGAAAVAGIISENQENEKEAEDKFENNFSPELNSEIGDLQKQIDGLAGDVDENTTEDLGQLNNPDITSDVKIEAAEKDTEYKSYYSDTDVIEPKEENNYVEDDARNFSALSDTQNTKNEVDYVNSKTEYEKPAESDFSNNDKTYEAFLEARKRRLEQQNETYSKNVEQNYSEKEPEAQPDRENIIGGGLGIGLDGVNQDPDSTNIDRIEKRAEESIEGEVIAGGDAFVPNKVYDAPEDKKEDGNNNDDIYNLNNFSI